MRLPLPAIVSPADVSSTFGRESCTHVPMHLDAFIGGGGRKGCLTEEGPGRVGTGSGWGVLVVTHRASVDPICGVKGRQVVGRGSGSWGTLVLGGEEDPGI
jgi:hypothetical protein